MIRPCWIKPDGEVVLCPNWGDHAREAWKAFPGSADSEAVAVSQGWLKAYKQAGEITFVGVRLTAAQRDTIEGPLFGLIADEVEEDAVSAWRFWQNVGRGSERWAVTTV